MPADPITIIVTVDYECFQCNLTWEKKYETDNLAGLEGLIAEETCPICEE